MKLSKKMEVALNEQINAEFWSAYLYLSMSNWFADQNLNGFANWMKVQYEEEMFHAEKFRDYIIERGGRVILKPIAEVQTEWDSVLDAFKDTLEHEQHVTSLIYNLVSIAKDEKDYASDNMLQWYVDEQMEEEASVEDILNQIERIEGNSYGLYMLDKGFASRTFVAPAE